MPVVRVTLVLAALSWTSWPARHCFLSGSSAHWFFQEVIRVGCHREMSHAGPTTCEGGCRTNHAHLRWDSVSVVHLEQAVSWRLQQARLTRVQSEAMVSGSALEATLDNAICARIWDHFWRLQPARVTRVQSEPMVSWCFGSNFGQCSVPTDLGPVVAIAAGGSHTRVQSEPMVSWFALERTTMGSAMCQRISDR